MALQIDSNKGTTRLTRLLFIVYLIGLSWIIVFKLGAPFKHGWHTRHINLVPFKRPPALQGAISFTEIVLNILAFVPFGLYNSILFKKRGWGWHVFLFFSVSLLYEISQYLLKCGISDTTDVINNTLGGAIGLLLYNTFEKACGNNIKAQKITNIVAVTGTALIAILLLLLKVNRLWLFK